MTLRRCEIIIMFFILILLMTLIGGGDGNVSCVNYIIYTDDITRWSGGDGNVLVMLLLCEMVMFIVLY